jgi:vacuolar-type H+-ATPase subunit H
MNDPQPQTRRHQAAENLAEVLVQGTARIIDLQTAAAQALLRIQCRNVALFGVPDWSQFFGGDNSRQFSEFCNASAEQALKLMRQTNDTLNQLQTEVNETLTRQAQQLAEQIRTSLQEIEQRTQQAVQQVREASQKTAQPVRDASEQTAQQARGASEEAQAALQGSGAEERARGKRHA